MITPSGDLTGFFLALFLDQPAQHLPDLHRGDIIAHQHGVEAEEIRRPHLLVHRLDDRHVLILESGMHGLDLLRVVFGIFFTVIASRGEEVMGTVLHSPVWWCGDRTDRRSGYRRCCAYCLNSGRQQRR